MLTGLCAFPLTPMSRDRVDEEALARLVSRAAAAGVDSLGVLGSTGLYPYLDREERRGALKAAVGAAAGTPVVAGIGALRTRDVLTYADDAQTAGASALLLAPVSYQRLTDEEAFGLYRDVSSAASVPVVVYDNPATTHFTFSDALYARIGELPNVASVKVPPPAAGTAGEAIGRLRGVLPAGMSVGVSGDWAAAEALAAGFDVWYSVLAGLFPQAAMAIVREAREAREERAAQTALSRSGENPAEGAPGTSASLEPLWSLFRTHGSLRVTAAAAEILGLAESPSLPRPLLGLNAGARAQVERALRGLTERGVIQAGLEVGGPAEAGPAEAGLEVGGLEVDGAA